MAQGEAIAQSVKEARYLSDAEIIDLYREFTARQEPVPAPGFTEKDKQFACAFWDVVLYVVIIVGAGIGFFPLFMALAWALFLGRWIPIGPISLAYWVTKSLNEPVIHLKPVDPYSVPVLRTVAEGLVRPVVADAGRLEEHLARKREALEALQQDSERLCKELRSQRLYAGELATAFDARLEEARRTSERLTATLGAVNEMIQSLQAERKALDSHLAKLANLEEAAHRLGEIESRMAKVVATPPEFQKVLDRMASARQHVGAIELNLRSYEQAIAEVQSDPQ